MLYDKLKTASRLKELRLEAGFTMEELAKKNETFWAFILCND
ncbi:helix-turn-helix transcriptional regulator [Ligilactobacillus salivarius]|nr:helix-turn-helix transcriptional regulator [Ligilactobacillus salivarius]